MWPHSAGNQSNYYSRYLPKTLNHSSNFLEINLFVYDKPVPFILNITLLVNANSSEHSIVKAVSFLSPLLFRNQLQGTSLWSLTSMYILSADVSVIYMSDTRTFSLFLFRFRGFHSLNNLS